MFLPTAEVLLWFITSPPAAMVGRRRDLKKLSDEMTMHSRLVLSGAMSVRIAGDDQELLGILNLGHILLKGIGLVIPDMLTKFFQVVTFAYKDLEVRSFLEILPAVRDIQQSALHELLADNEEWRHRSVIWNRISNTVPTFFHFPGCKAPAKTEPYYTNLWFMKVDNTGGTNASPEKQRPAEIFLEHIRAHADERFGYGASWMMENGWASWTCVRTTRQRFWLRMMSG